MHIDLKPVMTVSFASVVCAFGFLKLLNESDVRHWCSLCSIGEDRNALSHNGFTLRNRIFLLLGLLMIGNVPGLGQRGKIETIDATALGSSTQLGRNFGVKIIIYEFSSPEDREVLVQAFQKGQNDGLVNALEKMKSVGRIAIPGTLGYDLSFIREIITPTGRTIRFVTNRKIAFGEAYWDTQTKSFNLTAGEIKLNDKDKSKKRRCSLSRSAAHRQ